MDSGFAWSENPGLVILEEQIRKEAFELNQQTPLFRLNGVKNAKVASKRVYLARSKFVMIALSLLKDLE